MSRWIARNQTTWQRAAMLNVGHTGPKPGHQKTVRAYLEAHGPRTAAEIALGTNLTHRQVYSSLCGFATRLPGGLWKLTP